jgi:raffinose/stachyose/melibiose transport system substrate-binding protein
MPFPMVEGGNGNADIMGGGNGYILGKNAPDAAVDFLKFIISIKYNSLLAEQGRILPVVKGAEDALKDANMKEIVAAVSNAEYYQLYYDQYLPSDVGEELRDAVQGIFAGRISPKEAAQMIEKSAAANLK